MSGPQFIQPQSTGTKILGKIDTFTCFVTSPIISFCNVKTTS